MLIMRICFLYLYSHIHRLLFHSSCLFVCQEDQLIINNGENGSLKAIKKKKSQKEELESKDECL